MANIKQTWENLDAGKKRTFVLVGVVAIVFIILYGYVKNDNGPKVKATKAQPVVKSPLTGSKETSLGVEALAAKISRMEGQVKAMQSDREMDQTRSQANLEKVKSDATQAQESLKAELVAAKQEIAALKTEGIAIAKRDALEAGKPGAVGATSKNVDADTLRTNGDHPALIEKEWSLFDADATTVIPENQDPKGKKGGATGGKDVAPAAQPSKIYVIGELDKEPTPEEVAALKKGADAIDIPSGSILHGQLITGVDAPTGQQSKTTPMPALMRIKAEAILPNFASWDITECFVLMSGYGDLSTERYMGRAERLSCVSDKKQVLDIELDAFASGEDGKAGIRGRLVTRMGAAMLNSGIAGFFSGAAQAFGPQRVPVISTNANDQVYTPSASTVLNTGAGQGASKALDQIAEFYIKLAEQTLPVVEVDAAREVDLILVRPLSVPISVATR